MKKIKCQICGCEHLISKNGEFVCSECGMRYSTEEAKNLFVEVSEEQKTPNVNTVIEEKQLIKESKTNVEHSNKEEKVKAKKEKEVVVSNRKSKRLGKKLFIIFLLVITVGGVFYWNYKNDNIILNSIGKIIDNIKTSIEERKVSEENPSTTTTVPKTTTPTTTTINVATTSPKVTTTTKAVTTTTPQTTTTPKVTTAPSTTTTSKATLTTSDNVKDITYVNDYFRMKLEKNEYAESNDSELIFHAFFQPISSKESRINKFTINYYNGEKLTNTYSFDFKRSFANDPNISLTNGNWGNGIFAPKYKNTTHLQFVVEYEDGKTGEKFVGSDNVKYSYSKFVEEMKIKPKETSTSSVDATVFNFENSYFKVIFEEEKYDAGMKNTIPFHVYFEAKSAKESRVNNFKVKYYNGEKLIDIYTYGMVNSFSNDPNLSSGRMWGTSIYANTNSNATHIQFEVEYEDGITGERFVQTDDTKHSYSTFKEAFGE